MIKSILKKALPSPIAKIIGNMLFRGKSFVQFMNAKLFRNKPFFFNGVKYSYFVRLYNNTFLNERAVEIPVILDYLNRYKGKRILEIGNVISHYHKFNYDILDKYEKQEGVINMDIVDYTPNYKYDLIVSISTFEHIGYDENIRYGNTVDNTIKAATVLKAFEVTKMLLQKDGLFVFTIPIGFNHFLDSKLEKNEIGMTNLYYLVRINSSNKWKQVAYDDVKNVKYGFPFICANAILIGIFKNQ